jgi:hypothetical protein
VGLGEVLVGNYPGRALSFTCRKDAMDAPKVERRGGGASGIWG